MREESCLIRHTFRQHHPTRFGLRAHRRVHMVRGDKEQVAGCQMPFVPIRRRDTESWVASAHHKPLQHHNSGCRAREAYPSGGTYYREGISGGVVWRLFVGSLHRVLCGLRCVTHHGGTCKFGVRLSTGQVNVKC